MFSLGTNVKVVLDYVAGWYECLLNILKIICLDANEGASFKIREWAVAAIDMSIGTNTSHNCICLAFSRTTQFFLIAVRTVPP